MLNNNMEKIISKDARPCVSTPALRFREFTEGWVVKKLEELFKISAGGDIETENVSQIKNEIFKYPIYANAEKNKGFYGYSNVYKINENVITVAGRGVNIGIAHARNHKFYPIVRLLVLKPLNNENIYFFEYQINRLNLFKESTGVPQLTAPQVSQYEIYYPHLPEQTKIAQFLTAIDEKLQALKQKKTLLEQYKKGVMQKIFSQEIRFKNTEGGDFGDWEVKTLGEIAKFSKGKGISKSDISDNGITECIRYGELYTHNKETINDVKSKTNVNLKDLVISEANDVIIPASGETQIDIATASCVLRSGIALGGDLNIIKSDNNGVFLSYYLNSEKKFEIANLAQGISVVHLYSSQLALLVLKLPCHAEQTKIAHFLSTIDEKIEKCRKKIADTEGYKKGLMQRMFV